MGDNYKSISDISRETGESYSAVRYTAYRYNFGRDIAGKRVFNPDQTRDIKTALKERRSIGQ